MDVTEEESKSTDLETSNEDCVYKILQYLPLNDLCAVGQTCTRLQEFGAKYLHRKYPKFLSESVVIIEEENGVIGIKQTENHVKCFSRQIRNVQLCHSKMDERCAKYMHLDIGADIKQITFEKCEWNNTFIAQIEVLLTSVNKINLWDMKGKTIHLNGLQQVNHLHIKNRHRNILRNIQCPTLEVFEIDIDSDKSFVPSDIEAFNIR